MNSLNVNRRIIGLPLGFSPVTDPGAKVFNQTFVQNATVVNFIPGKPVFYSGKLRQEKNEILQKAMAGVGKDDWDGIEDPSSKVIDKSGLPTPLKDRNVDESDAAKVRKERDIRFYGFDVDVYTWRRMANVLLNEVGAKMAGISLGYNVEKFVDMSGSHSEGLHFYYDGSTTASESASNEVSESTLAGMARQVSDKARELAFITGRTDRSIEKGQYVDGKVMSEQAGSETVLTQAASAAASGAMSVASSIADSLLGESAAATAAGENILYPKAWKNSTFDKSYNISFKFLSPYGDPQSIFEYVYAPFLMLLPFALPQQMNPESYKAPMLIRLDSPGFLTCD